MFGGEELDEALGDALAGVGEQGRYRDVANGLQREGKGKDQFLGHERPAEAMS